MTSFIVASKDREKRLTYSKNYCSTLSIDTFDITLLQKDENSKNVSSIGIEDIKNMQKKLFLRPIKSRTKAIIIEDSHLLTVEAQNALLKVLEEPPDHTIIILSSETKDNLLPTILSRCQLIELEENLAELTPRELLEYAEFLRKLPHLSIAERLKKAEALAKDKQKAIEWIQKLILALREDLLKNVILVSDSASRIPALPAGRSYHSNQRDPGQARMTEDIRSFQSLHTSLKTTNVNPRFAIEDTLLKLI